MQEGCQSGLEILDRKQIFLTGVQNIDVFEEEKLLVKTVLGVLELQGKEFQVMGLDLEAGTLQVDGVVSSIRYMEKVKKEMKSDNNKRSLVKRLTWWK